MKLTTLFSITQILHLFQNKHTPFKTTKSYNFIPVDYVKSAPQIILFIYVFTFLLFRQLTFRICPKQSLVRSVNSPDIYLQVFLLLINLIYKTTKQRNFIVDRRTIHDAVFRLRVSVYTVHITLIRNANYHKRP